MRYKKALPKYRLEILAKHWANRYDSYGAAVRFGADVLGLSPTQAAQFAQFAHPVHDADVPKLIAGGGSIDPYQ